MTVPCKNCNKKGCGAYHSQCEEYQEYVKEREKIRKERFAENEYMNFRAESLRKVKVIVRDDKNSRY